MLMAQPEANSRLRRLLDDDQCGFMRVSGQIVCVRGMNAPGPLHGSRNHIQASANDLPGLSVITLDAKDAGQAMDRAPPDGLGEVLSFRLTLEDVHAEWKRGQRDGAVSVASHPLVPFVEAWQDRDHEVVGGDKREHALAPKGLIPHPPHVHVTTRSQEDADLPTGPIARKQPEIAELLLPEESVKWSGMPASTALLVVEEGGMATARQGRGARLDKRLFILTLLGIGREQRDPNQRYEFRLPLRQLVHWLWYSDAGRRSSWKPSRHGKMLIDAMRSVNRIEVLMLDGTTWLPIRVWQFPDPRDGDSEAVLEVRLPEGCDHGPRINRADLMADGMVSDAAFDLNLGLAFHWDHAKARNGGNRIYAERPAFVRNAEGHLLNVHGDVITAGNGGRPTGGRGLKWIQGSTPVRNWRHPDACPLMKNGMPLLERHPQADRVPLLNREQRVSMAYGTLRRPNALSRQREFFLHQQVDGILKRRASKVIVDGRPQQLGDRNGEPIFEKDGRYVIEIEPGGWRILETYRTSQGALGS